MPPKRKSDADAAAANSENGAEKPKKSKPAKESIPDVTLLDFKCDSKTPDGKPWNVKFSSWNVNGIRAWIEKNGHSYIKAEDPDIFCLQETKCEKEKIPADAAIDGYHIYWLSGDTEGYSGTGLYSKKEPLSVAYGINSEEHDKEGRVITAEFDKYYFVTAYVPNAGRKLVRHEYRTQKWDPAFRDYIKDLDSKKPVILCGDLNVAHLDIDLANPKNNKKNAGFTPEEREGMTQLLAEGFVDSYRHLYPEDTAKYTFWTYMMNARGKNVGWRLDYFIISERLKENLCDNLIRSEVMGSDHCPITCFMHFD